MLRTYECIPQCQLCMTLDWSVWFFIRFSWDNAHTYICTILINSSAACTVTLYLWSFITKHTCRRVNYSAWCSRLTNLCQTTYLSLNVMSLECVQRVTCLFTQHVPLCSIQCWLKGNATGGNSQSHGYVCIAVCHTCTAHIPHFA